MIWCVEDDQSIRDIELYALNSAGFETRGFEDGLSFWEALRKDKPKLIVLDVMLPGMDGRQIFKNMKEHRPTAEIPTLFLTARTELETRLESLQLGADDYIGKPFSSKELVLRVRNILKRANTGATRLMIHAGPLCLNKDGLQASIEGQDLELTTAEFKLLAYLMERPDKVQERYELQHAVLGYADTTQTRALDTHIKRLRQKLGAYADCIVTERGVGYYFTAAPLEN